MIKIIWAIGCVCVLMSCTHKPAAESNTLYAQLGGAQGVEHIVDNFLYQVSESELLLPLFEKTDIDRFHSKLTEQLCEISGGPCQYTGDPMAEVHAGMVMNNRHFDAVVTALIEAMVSANIPASAQNQLLAKLAAMHQDVMSKTKAP